jgi:hypothetical protein
MEEYYIHILWFVMSCCFGAWMYYQGAMKGTTAGVNAAVIFLTMSGKTKEAEEFVEFVNELSTKKIKFDK